MTATARVRCHGLVGLTLAALGCGHGASGDAAGKPDAMADVAERDAGADHVTHAVADAGADHVTHAVTDAGADAATRVDIISPDAATELVVEGAPSTTSGMADVAIFYPAGAASGVLTYTAVNIDASGAALSTRLASSTDQGATWTYRTDVNTPTTTSITSTNTTGCAGGTCPGTIVNEVSTVMEDPSDPDPSRLWKVITHRYFWLQGSTTPSYEYGHIALYTSSSPGGLWSAPQPLIGWTSPSSFSSTGVIATTTTAGIPSCLVLTEPSALVTSSGIWLAVGCISSATTITVELLESTDHLATFTHVGTIATADDATALHATAPRVNASHLFEFGGQTYVLVSPGNAAGNYLGCDVLHLGSSGVVERTGSGAPVISRFLDAPSAAQRGACAVAEGAPQTGYVMNIPQVSPLQFRVYKAGVAAL